MPDYDFQILQPNEFECLTRNLLQKREKIYIESFTPGRDGGMESTLDGDHAIFEFAARGVELSA